MVFMLHQGLHPEQGYVFEIARELGVTLKILQHAKPTASCQEKLNLLQENSDFKDWTLNMIVKALYFHRNGGPLIGIITPELNRNPNPREIFPKLLGISKSKAEKYWAKPDRVPKGMMIGTCSPFPLASSMGSEISDLIVTSPQSIDDKLVDISVGGLDEISFRTSMHLPYGAIYQILKRQFGERVHLYTQ